MSTGIMGVRTARNLGGRERVEYKPAIPQEVKETKRENDDGRRTQAGTNAPKPLSTKPFKVQLYKTRDCSGEPTDSLVYLRGGFPMDGTKFTIDKRGQGEKNFACCMKMENADVHATYTLGLESEKSEHTLNIKDTNKVILMEGGKVPPGVFNMHINGPVQCAQNVHLKASPLK